MDFEIIIIGGGASGLMAACAAASEGARVAVLEKMPRPGRKIMITGKGRCNFTNLKPWNDFSSHVRTNPSFLKPAFFNFTPQKVIEFFAGCGVESVVERGDRVYPASYKASDIVDALAAACRRSSAELYTDQEVTSVLSEGGRWSVGTSRGGRFTSEKLIISTGGLSYPATGSTGDGYLWAQNFGCTLVRTFPSLTALVPRGYKDSAGRGHIARSIPLSAWGSSLCGISLKNVGLSLEVSASMADSLSGDVDFTDGGIEGPLGFALSRDAVKAMINGNEVRLHLDMKPAVEESDLLSRIESLWKEICADPRSVSIGDEKKIGVLLSKLLPRPLVRPFRAANSSFIKGRSGNSRVDFQALVASLKDWTFIIDGYVGYERAVITAGGISLADIFPKTMECRTQEGLYFCGEVLDIDCDTGGYNLQAAFSTGYLAGKSAAAKL